MVSRVMSHSRLTLAKLRLSREASMSLVSRRLISAGSDVIHSMASMEGVRIAHLKNKEVY
jgi:hypothetical protein